MDYIAYLLEYLANGGNMIINAFCNSANKYPIVFLSAGEEHNQETVIRPDGTSGFHQILFILEGRGTLRCNGESYALKKGCSFFTSVHTPVEYINEGGLVSAFLTVTGSAADELNDNFADNGFLFYKNTNTAKYLSAIKQIIYEYQKGADQGKLSSLAYSFYVDFFESAKNEEDDWLDEIAKYINKNFSKKITLAALSQHFCVSASTLCHSFKSRYGVPIFKYILEIRLRYARNLFITSNNIMVKDAALMCGFSDIVYFCKAYKKKFGKTPTEDKKGGLSN
ncbi:MAG: helix-turn-helix transcriptional regulator [Clostridia bacterium]|nr:helix-turn-helix transcriptional regulator [Clostridia bacterium]